MKKRFLTITASILAGFIGLVPVASATVFQEYYTADDDGELKAEVVIYDLHPPTAPELLTPANGSETCLGTTPFSWREATDNKAVTAYKFSLTGTLTSGEGYNWEKSFGGAIETEEFQVWKENGVFYLRLKNKLGFGSYRWQVTASDSSNNSTESGWQNFEYTLKKSRQECIGSSETGKISLVSPKNSIDSRSPAINFVYTGSTLPVSFDVEVDGTAVFSEIPAVSSNTARYTVSHTLSSKNVIFQPLFAYLPEKSGTQSYAITVTVYLDDGCVASAQVTAELTGGSAQALVPQLISPSDDAVDSVPITTFVWDIADPSGILTGQIFTLNGVNLFNLGTQAAETDDYTLSVQEITGGDLGKTYRFKLTLKKTSYTVGGQKVGILTNNGNDSNDWNRWQVTAQARQTGSEAPALASPVWRFRYIAGILGTYHWCTGTASCQSGSLRECLATGRACYLSDEATCRANAPQDCGPNPPLRTYHWCTTGESCSQGTLKECSVTGKNCYMQENDVGGNGCLQNATFECSNEPEYVWCVTAHDCSRPGSLEECNAAGKTCFRLSASQRSCPVEAFDDCAVTTGVLADNPLGKIPEFMPSFLDQLGLSDEALIGLEALSTQAFPVVSLILLLPLGVLIIFFPRPRGRVFDSKTRHGVAGAVVTVLREGKFVNAAVSGRRGYYHGFKLAPGEYQIIVSTPRFIFPSFTERRRSTPMRNFYLGETFKVSSEFAPTVTFQVPVDLDPQVPLTDEQKRERERKHTGRRLWQALVALVNWMSGLWTLSFLIVIVFTLIYPIWLNIIILGIYVVGLVRRLMASLHHANITGRVVDANGQKVDGLALTCHTLVYHRLVGETRTDSNGRFEFFGNPHDKYQLSVAPFEFVEKTGRTATYLVDFGDDRAQELTLVVAEATDA